MFLKRSNTRTGRPIHLAEHYERQHIPLPLWSVSLVVKGLLRQQNCSEFKIFAVWKDLIGAAPNSDRLLEWPKEAAMALKRRLEFHEGTPREVATDAQGLALISNPREGSITSTTGNFTAATLSMPAGSREDIQIWQDTSRDQSPPVLAQADTEMHCMTGHI